MTIGHEQEYQLRMGDFDSRRELSPASLLDVFQDIAGISANATPGMSRQSMDAGGRYWVVTQTKYEVVKMPAMHERVIARTWPLEPTRMGIQREYAIRSLDGELLVKGTSEWVMVDKETRKFVSAKSVYDGPTDFSEETNFDRRPRRIRDFACENEPFDIVPGFSDIDVNGHVNNTKYANFFMSAWDPSPDEHIKSFQIDYRLEIREGEHIQVFAQREDGAVLGKGVGEDGETRFFCKAELA